MINDVSLQVYADQAEDLKDGGKYILICWQTARMLSPFKRSVIFLSNIQSGVIILTLVSDINDQLLQLKYWLWKGGLDFCCIRGSNKS